MKNSRRLRVLFLSVFAALEAYAAYAPVPATDPDKDFTISLSAAITHDSNIFGSASGAIDSLVYRLAPKAAYAASLTDQTYVSASYGLAIDQFENRPGDKTLLGHDLMARVAHAFSSVTNVSLTDSFVVAKNPESLLAGIPVNTDQSYQRNQFDAVFSTAPTKKVGLTVKARSMLYEYRSGPLGRSLDRTENLFGVSGDYAVLPEVKGIAEYRHQTVSYRSLSDNKDKRSDLFLAGIDYRVGPKISASSRLGVEFRRRSAERSTTVPYAEFSGRFAGGEQAFVSGGYVFTLEEASDVARFTDIEVNRFFVNAQHPLSPRIVASGSLTYEPSQLKGRRGQRDLDEETTRLGGALTYLAAKNWSVAATYDFDDITSEDASRKQVRHRAGVSATYAF